MTSALAVDTDVDGGRVRPKEEVQVSTPDLPPAGRARSRPTRMKAVADHAGVAVSSVSRVLSNHPDVSGPMRERVLLAVEELGYEVDFLAQSLRTGATRTVGVIISDISNPLFAQMAHGAETVLQAGGYSTFIANSLNDPALAMTQVRMLAQRRVDGLLVSVGEEDGGPLTEAIEAVGLPTVLIDRDLGVHDVSRVIVDHRTGMRAAAQRLVALGHRRIALVNGMQNVLPAAERAAALIEAAGEHPGVTVDVRSGAFSAAHGEAATYELLDAAESPTAIIAGGGQILSGVLEALKTRGLVAPDDVSLVTCDPVALAEYMTPPLDVIWRDSGSMGGLGAQVLLDMLGGRPNGSETVVTEYRPGGTVGPPRPQK